MRIIPGLGGSLSQHDQRPYKKTQTQKGDDGQLKTEVEIGVTQL